MARLGTIFGKSRSGNEHHYFETVSNCGADGEFYARVPDNIIAMMGGTGISLSYRKSGGHVWVTSKSMDGLQDKLNEICAAVFSRERISREIFIEYHIQTTASYVRTSSGELVPNGGYEWIGRYEDTNDRSWEWVDGTKTTGSSTPEPTGVVAYVNVIAIDTYRTRSGETVEECFSVDEVMSDINDDSLIPDTYEFKFLAGLCSTRKPSGTDCTRIKYTHEAAQFFVSMMKALWNINEKVKHMNDPEVMLSIIASGQSLLGPPSAPTQVDR